MLVGACLLRPYYSPNTFVLTMESVYKPYVVRYILDFLYWTVEICDIFKSWNVAIYEQNY